MAAGRHVTLVAVIAVSFALSAVAGYWSPHASTTRPPTQDSRSVIDPDLWALAVQFAPAFRFAADETYFPIDPQAMLDHAALAFDGTIVERPPIRSDVLLKYNDSRAYLSLALNGLTVGYLYDGIRPSYPVPVFVRMFENESGWTFLQYWVFYLANGAYFAHEGDWEMVQVNLRPGGVPNTFGYSQHLTGRARHWWDLDREGFHPIVYVGRGSHAAYFEPGYRSLAVDPCGLTGGEYTGDDVAFVPNADYVLLPLDGQTWLPFAGRWGHVTGKVGRDGPPGPQFRANGCGVRLWEPVGWFETLPQERTGPWPPYLP